VSLPEVQESVLGWAEGAGREAPYNLDRNAVPRE